MGNETKVLYLALRLVLLHLHELNIGFLSLIASIPISHQLSRQRMFFFTCGT